MGDIADMYVEAYAAGLDPSDMDGADWADFYSEGEPLSDAEWTDLVRDDLRVFGLQSIADAAHDGERLSDTVRRLFPNITPGQADGFIAVLDAMGCIQTERD